MQSKMKLYIGLLVVGLAVVGTGVGLMLTRRPGLQVPAESPIISAEALYQMQGARDQLFIYEDGQVIRVETVGLRIPTPDNPATTTWSKGALDRDDLNDVLSLVTSDYAIALEPHYYYSGNPSSDLQYTLQISSKSVQGSVVAFGYLSPDHGLTQPDMPAPLNDIYARLHQIAEMTKQVASEKLTQ